MKNKIITHVILFELIKFKPTKHNKGRCINCDGGEYCGNDFQYPCKMDEQLRFIKQ